MEVKQARDLIEDLCLDFFSHEGRCATEKDIVELLEAEIEEAKIFGEDNIETIAVLNLFKEHRCIVA
ncbi:MAG: hypothetical protein PHE67_04310 [Campylobacterales bacterium]|nr:hypothetical protein [Campylobacterales bacterium]